MGLVNRWYNILEFFFHRGEASLEELEQEFKLSKNTMKKTISLLNEELEETAKIVFSANNNLELEIYQGSKFENIMSGSLRFESDFNSSSKRVAFILKNLIKAEQESYLTISFFSEVLGVSIGTVNNDLSQARGITKRYDVTIEGIRNRGLALHGDEFNIRLLYINEVQDYFELTEVNNTVFNFLNLHAKKYKLRQHTKKLLRSVLNIFLIRIRMGRSIKKSPKFYQNVYKEHLASKELINFVESITDTILSDEESEFLTYPLNLNNTEMKTHESYNQNIVRIIFEEIMLEIHAQLIVSIDEMYLFDILHKHLVFLINRIIVRIHSSDILGDEIKVKYPLSYRLSKVAAQYLENKLGGIVEKSEINFLALYFELLFLEENLEKNRKIAIICDTGYGTSQMIRFQIEKIMGSDIDITQVSVREFEKLDLSKFFALFTSIPITVQGKTDLPIIHIEKLFNDEKLIEEFKNFTKLTNHGASDNISVFYKDLKISTNYYASLFEMTSYLTSLRIVDETFFKKVIERERVQTTIINNTFAFPHTTSHLIKDITILIGLSTEEESIIPRLIILLIIPTELNPSEERKLIRIYNNIFYMLGSIEAKKEIEKIQSIQECEIFLNKWNIL